MWNDMKAPWQGFMKPKSGTWSLRGRAAGSRQLYYRAHPFRFLNVPLIFYTSIFCINLKLTRTPQTHYCAATVWPVKLREI